jgi:hypothetical protein
MPVCVPPRVFFSIFCFNRCFLRELSIDSLIVEHHLLDAWLVVEYFWRDSLCVAEEEVKKICDTSRCGICVVPLANRSVNYQLPICKQECCANQCFGSGFIESVSGSSILGWIPIRIRSGFRVLMTRNWKNIQLYFFDQKLQFTYL